MCRLNPLSLSCMKKNFLKMMLLSVVVSVCFCSCDHVSFVHHVNSRCVARPVVHRPVVVHKPAPIPRGGKVAKHPMLVHNKWH